MNAFVGYVGAAVQGFTMSIWGWVIAALCWILDNCDKLCALLGISVSNYLLNDTVLAIVGILIWVTCYLLSFIFMKLNDDFRDEKDKVQVTTFGTYFIFLAAPFAATIFAVRLALQTVCYFAIGGIATVCVFLFDAVYALGILLLLAIESVPKFLGYKVAKATPPNEENAAPADEKPEPKP